MDFKDIVSKLKLNFNQLGKLDKDKLFEMGYWKLVSNDDGKIIPVVDKCKIEANRYRFGQITNKNNFGVGAGLRVYSIIEDDKIVGYESGTILEGQIE